jgi:hypothetical protein
MSESLVAPSLPFMQLRRLRHQMGGCDIVGQVLNVPVDMNNMVTALQRQLEDNYSFNVHLKGNLIHKSTYLQECIKKATVKGWLEQVIQTPLYKRYISIAATFLNVDNVPEGWYELDEINQHSSDSDAYLPNNTRTYGTKTNTWKYLLVKITNLLALYTMSMPKS